MPSDSATARAMKAARARYTLRRFEVLARGGKPRRPLCLVYGNCQAEPIRALLASSDQFARSYDAVPIPAVHEITASQTARLRRVLRAASLLIAQPITEGYRGLPLGITEVAACTPRDCRVVRFPALHYDALYPLQVNVHVGERLTVSTPKTVYHDLRTLCAAARGLSADAAVRWVSEYRPPEHALRAAASQAAAMIRARESATDVHIFDRIIASPQEHGRSFFTVNHPARFVLRRIASRLLDILEFPQQPDDHHGEPLGVFRTPLEQPVIDALGLVARPAPDWIIKGKRVPTADVVRLHLDWYRQHSNAMRHGLSEHAERIAAFGLLL
jgi:hypothetical protein